MNEVVFIIKDKVSEILKKRKANFANIDWEIEEDDIIEIFNEAKDIWSDNVLPLYSIKIKDAKYDNPEFNRTYEKFIMYKPDSDIFAKFHIAFILHKEENHNDDSISMKIIKN